MIVENMGGAGGNIGAEEVFRADPDGIRCCSPRPVRSPPTPTCTTTCPTIPAKSLPIAVLATSAYVLVLNNGLDSPNLALCSPAPRQSRQYHRRNTRCQLGQPIGDDGARYARRHQTAANPLRRLNPAVADILAGNIDMMLDMLATSLPLYRAQKGKIVVDGSTERVKDFPDVRLLPNPACRDIAR